MYMVKPRTELILEYRSYKVWHIKINISVNFIGFMTNLLYELILWIIVLWLLIDLMYKGMLTRAQAF